MTKKYKSFEELLETIKTRSRAEKLYWLLTRNLYRFSLWYNLRQIKFFVQRITRGFSDDELWSLDITLCKLILPRLKRFRNLQPNGYPCELTYEKWLAILDEMIVAFEIILQEEGYPVGLKDDLIAQEQIKTVENGMKLFHEYFFALWD